MYIRGGILDVFWREISGMDLKWVFEGFFVVRCYFFWLGIGKWRGFRKNVVGYSGDIKSNWREG